MPAIRPKCLLPRPMSLSLNEIAAYAKTVPCKWQFQMTSRIHWCQPWCRFGTIAFKALILPCSVTSWALQLHRVLLFMHFFRWNHDEAVEFLCSWKLCSWKNIGNSSQISSSKACVSFTELSKIIADVYTKTVPCKTHQRYSTIHIDVWNDCVQRSYIAVQCDFFSCIPLPLFLNFFRWNDDEAVDFLCSWKLCSWKLLSCILLQLVLSSAVQASVAAWKTLEKPAKTEIGQKRLHLLNQEFRNTIRRQ